MSSPQQQQQPSPHPLHSPDIPPETSGKSVYERFFHAVLFEVLALLLCAPVLSWLCGVPVAHAGLLTLMISLVAMLWNVLFNSLFDRLSQRRQWQRTFAVRVLHACLFETGLLLAVVPMAAWWLEISLSEAFLLDIGLVLFFLPYTLVYNWCYDRARATLRQRRMRQAVRRNARPE